MRAMSEPAKLQGRLRAEFEQEPQERQGRRHHQDGAGDAASPLSPSRATGQAAPIDQAILIGIVAGLAVLSAALVLVTGFLQEFYAATLGLAAAGIAGALLVLRGGLNAERHLRRRVERHRDRVWEQDETAAVAALTN